MTIAGEKTKSRLGKYLIWAISIVVGQVIGSSLILVLVGLIFQVPLTRLGIPFALLVWCASITPILFAWVRLGRGNQRSHAFRRAVAFFVYSQLLAIAFGASAVYMSIVSESELVGSIAAPTIICLCLASVWIYFATSRASAALQKP